MINAAALGILSTGADASHHQFLSMEITPFQPEVVVTIVVHLHCCNESHICAIITQTDLEVLKLAVGESHLKAIILGQATCKSSLRQCALKDAEHLGHIEGGIHLHASSDHTDRCRLVDRAPCNTSRHSPSGSIEDAQLLRSVYLLILGSHLVPLWKRHLRR